MEKRLQKLHSDTFEMYHQLAETTRWAQNQVKNNSQDMEYCADIAFAMNELDKLVKDIGVEIRKTKQLAETLVGVTWIKGADAEPIRTPHCTATPRLKLQPALPRKDTPELARLYDWLGIKEGRDVVRVHWPALCERVTKMVENGKTLPSWIKPEEMHSPSVALTFYKRKEVTEE